MVRIVIVENNVEYQRTIKNTIRKLNADVETRVFPKCTKELKELIDNNIERIIYILDIKLDKISGIDIAKYIRDKDWDSEIIFVTNHDRMFETAHREVIKIYDFIEKFHDMENRLEKDLNKIIRHKYNDKVFKRFFNNTSIQVFYNQITYINRDKEDRMIIINTDNQEIKIRMTLQECLEELDDRFKQVHRACIVNTERVIKYDWRNKIFTLDNGSEIPLLSKKYQNNIE